jgi:hypothetical protein
MTTFYRLRFETPPTWRARSRYLYPPRTGWPGYTPRYWVPFASYPSHLGLAGLRWRYSTPELTSSSRSLLPAISRHAHTWRRAPLGPMAMYLLNVKTFVFSPSLILLIDKGAAGLFLYRLVFTYYTLLHLKLHFSPPRVLVEYIYINLINYKQNITWHLVLIYTVTSVSAGLCSSLCLNVFNPQKRQLDTWTVVDLTAAKFKPLMFPMHGTYIWIFVI